MEHILAVREHGLIFVGYFRLLLLELRVLS
jgi:hypothetical protein